MKPLDESRAEINRIDSEMARLFCRRMEVSADIARYKKLNGLPITDEARERAVVEKNSAFVEKDEYRSYYISFIKSCMELSKSYQSRLLEGLRVAYCGIEGAFADIAARRVFPGCTAVSCPEFKSAYRAVEDGSCDCVILPIENSFAGDVGQVMDLAFFGSLFISGLYDFEVEHQLLGTPDATADGIREVLSHPQALSQCEGYIRAHGFKPVPVSNTAVAARDVAKRGDPSIAAIGSDENAALYGLKKLDSRINDSGSNTTRFAVFTREKQSGSNSDSEFIMLFTVKNEAGSLGKAVTIIGNHGFNLKALKSRPTKEHIFEYYFYVEGEGNICSPEGEAMQKELSAVCSSLKIIGSF